MKEGDIVYFKSTYKEEGESYEPTYHTNQENLPVNEYRFYPGDRYRIDKINYKYVPGDENITITGTITNLEDGTSHFAHSEIWNRLITVEEWREIQLSKIL
jgi:hypothetical protein